MAKEKMDRSRQKDTFIKVLNYIKPYWFYLALSLVLAAVTVALTLYLPKLTGFAVDEIIEQGRVNFTGILQILKLMAVTILITAVAQWIMNICNNKMTYEIVRDIRNEAFRKIEILPLKYIDGHSYGEITSRVIADVDQFADGLLMGFTQLFTGVMTILGTLLFMLTTDVGITLVVVLITPLSFFVAGFIAKRTFTMFRVQSETRGEQTALIDEMIGNQKVVQAFSHEKRPWNGSMRSMRGSVPVPCGRFFIPPSPIRPPVSSTTWCMPAWAWWAPCPQWRAESAWEICPAC